MHLAQIQYICADECVRECLSLLTSEEGIEYEYYWSAFLFSIMKAHLPPTSRILGPITTDMHQFGSQRSDEDRGACESPEYMYPMQIT